MNGYPPVFKSVKPLPHWKLDIQMETGSIILFDFTTRIRTARFGSLENEEVFRSVTTDGDSLIFFQNGKEKVNIPADTFWDLLRIDRTKPY